MSIKRQHPQMRMAVVLAGLFFLFLFTGCSNQEKKQETVKIGMVTFPGYAPLYLAKEKKLFDDLNVELVRIESVGDIRAALNSGKIDMYAATFDIFQSIDKAEPPGIGFLAIDESHGGDGVVVSKEIKNIEDLKGKTLGAEPGLPPYFILKYMLYKAGLTLNDVQFKDISSQDAGNAFVAGRLDAAGTYEPFLSNSVKLREGSRVLISSADTPGLIVDLLFASDKLVAEKPHLLKKVAEGWFKAVDYWGKNQDESMEVMSKAFGVKKEELVDIKSGLKWMTLQDNKQLFDSHQKNNVYETFDLVGDILVKNGSNGHKVYAKDKLTAKTINDF